MESRVYRPNFASQFSRLEDDAHPGRLYRAPSTYRHAACACPRFEALADETINREWAGPANNEGCEAGDIEQVDLITYRSEFRARRRHREELDRAEPIRQVHFKHGHQ